MLERAPIVLFRHILKDPNLKTYGRRGQRQQGVDLFGKRDGDPEKGVGIQCKLKSDIAKLTKKIVKDEVDLALTFKPPLKEYFIITTAPDDAEIEEYARELEVHIKKDVGRIMSIQVWGWNTMQREIQRYPEAVKAFWPDYTAYAEQTHEAVARLSAGQEAIKNTVERFEGMLVSATLTPTHSTSDTDERDPLELHIDAEIDTYRDKINQGQPKVALELLEGLQARLPTNVSARITFRLKANIAACYLRLGDIERGNTLIFEACSHAPDEPKAKVNLVFAYLRKGDWKAAIDLGFQALKISPDNAELAGALIQALQFDENEDQPIQRIPEGLRQSKEVRIAYLFFMRQRDLDSWKNEAKLLRKIYPDDDFVIQAAAEAVLDTLLSDKNVSVARSIPPGKLAEATAALQDMVSLWRRVSAPDAVLEPQHLALFTNLILTCDILHEVETAKHLLKGAGQQALDDEDVLIRVVQLAFNADESELFQDALRKLPPGAAKFQFAFFDAMRKGDWQAILELRTDANALEHDSEREFIETALKLAPVMTFAGSIKAADILVHRSNRPADLRSWIILHDALLMKGFRDEAEKLFGECYEKVLREDSFAVRAMTAHRAADLGHWTLIPDLLGDLTDTQHDSRELRLLATAYVNIRPARRTAVDFFAKLPTEIRNSRYYVRRAGNFHFNRGAFKQAERCYRQAIESEKSMDLELYLPLMSLLLRQQETRSVEDIIRHLLKGDIEGTGPDKCMLAHLFCDFGYLDDGAALAYKILKDHPDDAEVHSGFCKLILTSTRKHDGRDLIPDVAEVEADCWAQLQTSGGAVRSVLISSDPTIEPTHLFSAIVAADQPFAQACLGKKIGDEVSLPAAFDLGVARWTIKQIKHRYLQALHTIMDEFDIRFPGSSEIGSMETVEGDVQPILDYVKKRSEYYQGFAGYYSEQAFPIRIVAALQGTTSIEYALFLQRSGHEIKTCRGNLSERHAVISEIKSRRIHGAVLDSYTAWVAASVGMFDILRKVFDVCYIAQSCIDEISRLCVQVKQQKAGSLSISWHGGAYFNDELTEDTLRKQVDYVESILSQITENCVSLPVSAPDEIGKLSQKLVSDFSTHMLDPAFCALEGRMLLCEDMFYRQLAEQEFGLIGAWLQPVLMFSLANELITTEEYSEHLARLAGFSHDAISVSSRDLITLAVKVGDEAQIGYERLARCIGTQNADIQSHLRVTRDALADIWRVLDIDQLRRMRLTGTLLESLLRYRQDDWPDVLASIFTGAPSSLRRYIWDWAAGHFLPLDEFQTAINLVLNKSRRIPRVNSRALIASYFSEI